MFFYLSLKVKVKVVNVNMKSGTYECGFCGNFPTFFHFAKLIGKFTQTLYILGYITRTIQNFFLLLHLF